MILGRDILPALGLSLSFLKISSKDVTYRLKGQQQP